jgi:hypothetical protein
VLRDGYSGDALYIAWKLKADADSAGDAKAKLTGGQRRKLYRLQSWVIVNGQAQALLEPAAPLDDIAHALLEDGVLPLRSRWITGERACAAEIRKIETTPVQAGLAARPEEWPLSSAAGA